ncbi:hypothetical protein [Mesorhizobium sp. Root157]|uniref:hypothetical protein n=1 Tax=Mesorhizobium sp. Root157 TaxID=1736477 RepID=UPI0012E37628|nr:hypothetical protein [Mesorhizobium sp. Root157]
MPALRWLAKKDPAAALAVIEAIRDSRHQTHHESAPGYLNPAGVNADDAETCVAPDETLTSETLAEPTQGGPDEIHAEALHEIRPSERDLCRALGWVEFPYTGRSAPLGWCMRLPHRMMWPTEGGHLRPTFDGTRAHLAGMTFATGKGAVKQHGGLMISYTDATGKEQRPSYTTSKPRGGKRPHRTNAAIAAYLAMPAAIPSPLRVDGYRRPMSGEPALMPMLTPLQRRAPDKSMNICGQIDREGRYGVAEARAELVAFGVDGSVPFERLPFPATRCPTVIARGARFIAGISSAKQTASVPAPSWQMPETKALSPIIEEVAARGNLESIGGVLGYKGGSRDRAGGKALLAASRALVASNDNRPQRAAQAA